MVDNETSNDKDALETLLEEGSVHELVRDP